MKKALLFFIYSGIKQCW